MFIGAHEAEYMFVTTLLKIEQHLLAQGRCPYRVFRPLVTPPPHQHRPTTALLASSGICHGRHAGGPILNRLGIHGAHRIAQLARHRRQTGFKTLPLFGRHAIRLPCGQ